MANMLQKRISKLLTPLKNRRTSSSIGDSSYAVVNRTLTVVCTADQTTEDVLAQLRDVSQNKHVTCVVLREMIQRSDNIQLFSRIQDLLRESRYFSNVRSIHLVEPHVHCTEYRRWCFKKTNFLHRVRKEAKERHIDVTIHGTLILEDTSAAAAGDSSNSSCNRNNDTPQDTTTTTASRQQQQQQQQQVVAQQQQQQQQNVSGWLSLIQQLQQDPDITSLWIYLPEDIPVVNTASSANSNRRPSQLELQQSPVQKVFQALVELFNADTRRWQFINCHIRYHPSADDKAQEIHREQTQSLLEVAELFHIPLQVQWEPSKNNGADDCSDDDTTVVDANKRKWTRMTLAAMQTTGRGSTAEAMKHGGCGINGGGDDDNTSTTAGMDGSSGAFTAPK